MSDQGALWDGPPAIERGRVRRGVDAEASAAKAAGTTVAAAALAALRVLADQLDAADAQLRRRGPLAKPYDRVPLAQLARQFEDMHRYVFGAVPAVDPLERALDEFRAATGDHAAHGGRRD